MHFYACISITGSPLGYIKADTSEEAEQKARAKWPEFGRCYRWDGVL